MFLSDTAGDRDGREIWRREQSRIETSHYSLCVPPRAPERTGKKIISIIDPRIDSQLQMTLHSPIHQRLCDDGAALLFQTLCHLGCSLMESCTDLSLVDSLLSKQSGIFPIIPLPLTHEPGDFLHTNLCTHMG